MLETKKATFKEIYEQSALNREDLLGESQRYSAAVILMKDRQASAYGICGSRAPCLVFLDHDETYNLYQCLHTLFHPITPDE